MIRISLDRNCHMKVMITSDKVFGIKTCPWCPSYAGGGTAQAWRCPCWQTWSLLDIMIMVIMDKSLMNCIWWRRTCTDLYVGVGYESFQARSWVVVLLHLRLREKVKECQKWSMPEVDNAGVNENGDDVDGDDGVTLKFTWRMSSCRQPSARARKARTRKGAAEYLAMRSILDDDGDVCSNNLFFPQTGTWNPQRADLHTVFVSCKLQIKLMLDSRWCWCSRGWNLSRRW